jgi:hypothetical protein
MSSNDGGPAFPVPTHNDGNGNPVLRAGMTLRDWFAGQALVGLIGVMEANDEQLATAAYEIADAMMLVSRGGGA